MNRTKQLSQLMADFVFRDRRIADQPSLKVTFLLADGRILRRVATSSDDADDLPDITIGEGITGKAFSARGLAVAPDMPTAIPEPGDDTIRSMIACPIVGSYEPIGVLNLASQVQLEFNRTDIPRVQILSALVAYEAFHLQQRLTTRSQLSEELGRVLRGAREELDLTQNDLAALVGTSRIAVSRWETGAQPPSRGPLRRWGAALGLLAGGHAEIIKVVDATPQLLELLRSDPGRLAELSPEQFEVIVAERLDRMGYAVQRTGSTTLRDGGIDIIAAPKTADLASFLLAVQVKHHHSNRPTGRDAVDRLLAWQNTPFRLGLLVTNTRFTRDAIWTASRDPAKHFLRLRDFADLSRWLRDVFNSPLDWREIPDSIELAPGVSVEIPKPQFTEAGIVWPIRNVPAPDA
jgi:transcriptional regulator with XRE-family HTH domain